MSALLLRGCIIADFFFRGKRVVDGKRTPELGMRSGFVVLLDGRLQGGKCGWLLGL